MVLLQNYNQKQDIFTDKAYLRELSWCKEELIKRNKYSCAHIYTGYFGRILSENSKNVRLKSYFLNFGKLDGKKK